MKPRFHISNSLSKEDQACLVEEAEKSFDGRVEKLASRILAEEAQVIGLTGPTCSGKTTAAAKLTRAFAEKGKILHVISIDDFYYNKDYLHTLALQNGREEPDYDSEETIDTDLLSICTESLIRGEQTRLPRFNFHTGMREAGELITPERNGVFLFEGIQILYPAVEKILKCLPHYQSLCICPFSELETGGEVFLPNEIRLMRRLVRDFRFRSTDPSFTLRLWQGVRENEEKSIFPYLHRCTGQLDSTMPYEIGMLKPYLEAILPTVPPNSEGAATAERILSRLRQVQPIPSKLLPNESLYKEFI